MANSRMFTKKIEKRPFTSECECRRVPGGPKRDHGQQEKPFFHRVAPFEVSRPDAKHRRVFRVIWTRLLREAFKRWRETDWIAGGISTRSAGYQTPVH